MALYLQERCNAEKQTREEILPSAQMLLLHFIYKNTQEMYTSKAIKDLGFLPFILKDFIYRCVLNPSYFGSKR